MPTRWVCPGQPAEKSADHLYWFMTEVSPELFRAHYRGFIGLNWSQEQNRPAETWK